MTPVEAQRWVRDTMEKTFLLGVFCDRTKQAQPRPAAKPAPALEELPRILEIENEDGRAGETVVAPHPKNVDLRVRVAGFGGQGVLLLGEMLAEAGLDAGLEVSWLPSYGPEMRSGTSNCQVRIASEAIDSPLVPVPNVLIAMNEPSLRKFDGSVRPGGWVIYNGEAFPEDCKRADVQVLALPFAQIANELGDPRMANMIMLGAMLEITQNLPQASIDAALRRLVKKPRLVELGQHALDRGRVLFRASRQTVGV
jgi:Pyruvate/2-oxoacid:ferredoxin oxidoreductase gamma subunit